MIIVRQLSLAFALFCLLGIMTVASAMPHVSGLPEPRYPAGVNAPERELPNRDEPNLEGEWRCLVLLIDFPDYPWDNQNDTLFNNEGSPYTTEHFGDMLFSEGEYAHPGARSEFTGSMRDYFTEISGGMFTVTGTVTRWYRAPRNYRYYVNNDGRAGTDDDHGFGAYPNNVQKLVEDAIEAADRDVDFRQFDNDGDGLVDALFLVHAGPGAEALPEEPGVNYIWSHKWNIRPQRRDGVNISTYTFQPQDGTIGVFCHEFGHALGLPDLYDTDYSSEGIGEWGLMGGGGWNHRLGDPLGSCPIHMCAWSKLQLGWVEVTNVVEPLRNVVIEPVVNSGQVYRLWRNGDEGDEYFLVENRRRTGFDAGLTRRQVANELPDPEGLLILHIDESRRNNSDERHRLVDVEEASPVWVDGEPIENLDLPHERIGTDLRLVNRGDNGDLWPGFSQLNDDFTDWVGDRDRNRFDSFTVPSSRGYGRQPSFVRLSNIRLNGDNVRCDMAVAPEGGVFLFPETVEAMEARGGNDNGWIEPGESFDLYVDLNNHGDQRAVDVSAVLDYEGDLAEILLEAVNYPPIAPGGGAGPEEPFTIRLSRQAPERIDLNFTMNVSSNDTAQFEFPITVEITPSREWFKWPRNPVLFGGDDDWDRSILSPAVLVEDSLIHCWYIGVNFTQDEESLPAVGYAASNDGGETWRRREEPVLIPDPEVQWMSGGFIALGAARWNDRLVMGLSAQDMEGVTVIALATSEDGLNWDLRQDPVLRSGEGWILEIFPMGQLSVFNAGDQLGIAFSASQGEMAMPALGAAFTVNLVDWQLDQSPALFPTLDEADFDAYAVFAPDVYIDGADIHLLYSGLGQDFISRIGRAEVNPQTGDVTRHQGRDAMGSILAPGGPGAWEVEYWLLSARLFEWQGEMRLLYTAMPEEMDNVRVCLATEDPHPLSAPALPRSAPQSPAMVTLHGGFPNPFNSAAGIQFDLMRAGRVRITIHDLTGRLVAELTNQEMAAGRHTVSWNGTNAAGKAASSGMYIVQVHTFGLQAQAKLLLLR